MQKDCLNKSYLNDNNIYEIGIDEAGRGPMFGRVYTAAVILPSLNSDFNFSGLKDSKRFHSVKKIKEMANYIKSNCISYSISWQSEKDIDIHNIRISTFNSMHIAIKNILNENNNKFNKYFILVDGNDFIPYNYIDENNMITTINYKCIEGGDNKYCSIAAASILAKVARDEYIEELCKNYPKLDEYYQLSKNKGYGTSGHINGIYKYGISCWHRKTFGICANIFENNEFND